MPYKKHSPSVPSADPIFTVLLLINVHLLITRHTKIIVVSGHGCCCSLTSFVWINITKMPKCSSATNK